MTIFLDGASIHEGEAFNTYVDKMDIMVIKKEYKKRLDNNKANGLKWD